MKMQWLIAGALCIAGQYLEEVLRLHGEQMHRRADSLHLPVWLLCVGLS